MTLTLTHDAIHALNEEASYLKNQFQYVSTQVTFSLPPDPLSLPSSLPDCLDSQQEKLAILLKHYTDRQAISPPETHDTPPHPWDQSESRGHATAASTGTTSNPLEAYGKEVRKTFEVFITKVLKLQEENQEVSPSSPLSDDFLELESDQQSAPGDSQ
jgi:hypothetical protein